MSSNNPESQGQEWPIYPGTPRSNPIPEPVEGRPSPEPAEGRPFPDPHRTFSEPHPTFSEPVEEKSPRDDAYRAYESYLHQPMDHQHFGRSPEPVEGQRRRTSSSNALQKKYVWIAIGIVAALVLTSIARGGFNLWPLIIFGAIAWWVVGNKRKC